MGTTLGMAVLALLLGVDVQVFHHHHHHNKTESFYYSIIIPNVFIYPFQAVTLPCESM